MTAGCVAVVHLMRQCAVSIIQTKTRAATVYHGVVTKRFRHLLHRLLHQFLLATLVTRTTITTTAIIKPSLINNLVLNITNSKRMSTISSQYHVTHYLLYHTNTTECRTVNQELSFMSGEYVKALRTVTTESD